MKIPPEQSLPKNEPPAATKPVRRPILPTVFVRSSALREQLRGALPPDMASVSLSALTQDIAKKSVELRERLHELRHAPSRPSSFAVQEAETVLAHAEGLLAAMPSGTSSTNPDISVEKLCRTVDVTLMLDAAMRALQSP